ncbi:MAG: serine/threonine protein kinase [Myxococcales bacterium]|nr:serine/threonine protein kinase [Myxococcales bacterium]
MSNQLPQPFGKYILLNKIAMGGMAEIFRAKTLGAEGFEKEVVIKRILPHFTEDESFVTMFIDEAKVSSKLSHPNIVQIYDFDLLDGCYYISMEFVEGKDLKRVVDVGVKTGRGLTVAQMVHIGAETAKGLHYAHTKLDKGQPLNIVHRDVSPHNVMVSYEGDVKVMDFGIAKAAARSTKTRAGTVKGKCAYMSPEQARGKNLDGRSDMFAVGVMLWEMLTNHRLFAGESDFETLSNVLKQEAPPPSSLNPEVPASLDAIILKCLSKERDERQADCRELARELEKWLYENVADRHAAELGKYMEDLFSDDIAALREMQSDDGQGQIAEVSEAVRSRTMSQATMGQSSGSHKAVTGSRSNVKAVQNDARTIALDVNNAPGLNSERTVAVDTSSMPIRPGMHTPEKKKSPVLWVVLALVLVGGGVGGFLWWQSQQQAAAATAQAQAATAAAAASAQAAQVAAATDVAKNGNGGDPVVNPGNPDAGKLPAEAAPAEPVKPKTRRVVFHATPADATLQARGLMETGKLEIEGNIGDVIVVQATHPDYEALAREITVVVGEGDQRVDMLLTTKKVVAVPVPVPVPVPAGDTLATMVFTVTPPDAQLSINGQPQTAAAPGQFKVMGYKVGEDVEVTVSASGFKKESENLRVTAAEFTKSFDLKKNVVVVAPTGPGKVSFKAKPWAKVMVGGKSCVTSCTLELPSGKHSAVFEQGGVTKRVSVTVKADATVSVFQDMTQ